MAPPGTLDMFAALMIVVAAASAARLVAARPWRHGSVVLDTDVAHLLMAVAMAGMLTPGLAVLPSAAWAVIFGLMTAWFAVRVLRDASTSGVRALAGGHCAPHLVHSGAMLYMFLALATPAPQKGETGGMGLMAGGAGSTMTLSYPTLGLVFALMLMGYSIWDTDQLSGRRYSLGTARVTTGRVTTGRVTTGRVTLAGVDGAAIGVRGTAGFLLSPAVTVGCRIAMGVAMAFTLLATL